MKNIVELKIGEKTLKLGMKTRQVVALEKALGKSPLNILMDAQEGALPPVNDMLIILWAALQQYEHGYNMEAVYDLYDEYVEAGNTMMDLIPLVIDVLSVSGYIKIDEAKPAKKKAK
jgi:hypothetical protein